MQQYDILKLNKNNSYNLTQVSQLYSLLDIIWSELSMISLIIYFDQYNFLKAKTLLVIFHYWFKYTIFNWYLCRLPG